MKMLHIDIGSNAGGCGIFPPNTQGHCMLVMKTSDFVLLGGYLQRVAKLRIF